MGTSQVSMETSQVSMETSQVPMETSQVHGKALNLVKHQRIWDPGTREDPGAPAAADQVLTASPAA